VLFATALLLPVLGGLGQPHPPLAVEQEVVLVCVDWRNRDAIARTLLPHDAVFLYRLFGDAVSNAVQASGGIECDPGAGSVVAVFGVDLDLPRACRDALSGARRMESTLSELAGRWEAEFGVEASSQDQSFREST
jgi:adenylate cyclase